MNHSKIKQILLASALACASPAFAAVIYGSSGLIDQNIPDNNAAGTSSTIKINDSGTISSLEIFVSVEHGWVGDLIYTLTDGTATITLMNQPSAPLGNSSRDLTAQYPLIFSDSALVKAETIGAVDTPGQVCTIIGGSSGCTNTMFIPIEALSTFNGTDVQGDWTLNISDNWAGDTGILAYWYLAATVDDGNGNTVPEPATLALVGLAMAGMALSRRRRSA
jgi:subtilisin-like proprotein convertase family protein